MRCGVCSKGDLEEFFRLSDVPILCNVLWPSRDQALAAPRGEIRLGFCGECGYVCNTAFDPSAIEYTEAYRNPLHYSRVFREYIEELIGRLIEQYDLRGKDIIEIGCGDGYFLSELCRAGANRGLGFDPVNAAQSCGSPDESHVRIIPGRYGIAQAQHPVDFICCRHVLEHVYQPLAFLAEVRETIGNRCRSGMYFEVPNALYMLEQMSIWDVIYEHCSYFAPPALDVLFRRAGFGSIKTAEHYERQFLSIEAGVSAKADYNGSLSNWAEVYGRKLIERFAEAHRGKTADWRNRLEHIRRRQSKIVVWGCGSKGVSFLNALSIGKDAVKHVIDMDRGKWGRFVAGTGQRVVGPEFLRQYRPELIIIMNPIYQREIGSLMNQMSVDAQFLVA